MHIRSFFWFSANLHLTICNSTMNKHASYACFCLLFYPSRVYIFKLNAINRVICMLTGFGLLMIVLRRYSFRVRCLCVCGSLAETSQLSAKANKLRILTGSAINNRHIRLDRFYSIRAIDKSNIISQIRANASRSHRK